MAPHWEPIRPVDSVADLEFIGISLQPPADVPVYFRADDGELVKEIGTLLDPRDGRLLVFPRRDLTLQERSVLLGVASKSYTERRSSPAWETYTYKGQRRHRSNILVPADAQIDRTAHRIAALEEPQRNTRQVQTARDVVATPALPLDGMVTA